MTTKSKFNRTYAPFVLDTDSTFRWPVIVKVPDADKLGSKVKMQFEARFRHVSEERRMQILAEHRRALAKLRDTTAAGDEDEDDDASEGTPSEIEMAFGLSQKVLNEVLDRCEGIVSADRNPVEWGPEVKRALIVHQMVWPALYAAYMEAIAQQDAKGN